MASSQGTERASLAAAGAGACPEDGCPEVSIQGVALGGDGVAREPGGRVLFVPRTAPGDRVRVQVTEERRRYARALPVELLAPGPGRASPPCPSYAAGCGGCQLQHLADEAQRDARRQGIRDALERIGGLVLEVPALLRKGTAFHYRNRVAFTLRRKGGHVVGGYRRFDAPGELVDVEECPLAEAPVNRAWRALREAWGPGGRALPGAEAELRVTVRASRAGRVALLVRGGDPGAPGEPGGLARAVEGLAAYHWRDDRGRRRHLAGGTTLAESWEGLELDLRPEAFLQVNRWASDLVSGFLDGLLGPPASLRILDLYAGVGTRAIRWALDGGRVIACEVGRDAVATGREAARRHGAPVRFVRGRVEDHLDGLLPADVVMVNPPRAGLSSPVSRRLARGGAERLVYVSCDPATLARDLRRLAPGWEVEGVQPFDAFPQTAHVETVAWLRRRPGVRPSGGRP